MESFDSSFVLESPESAVKIRTITKDSVQKDIFKGLEYNIKNIRS
jgi:hypothetical protein